MKYTLLIVDDNLKFANNLSVHIYKSINNLINVVRIANNGKSAIEIIKDVKPDIVLLDLQMPKLNGLEVINQTKNLNMTIMVISGELSMINKIRLGNSKNIRKVYIKPFPINVLINDLKYICNEYNQIDIREKIEKQLDMFEFNKSSIGYRYLIECLIYTYQNPKFLDNMENDLFPLVAKKFQRKKGQNIKWSIQKTMKAMIRYTPTNKIKKVFPNTQMPTVKFFMRTINNFIKNN